MTKSIKLTNKLRDQIIDNIMQHYDKENNAPMSSKEAEYAFATACHKLFTPTIPADVMPYVDTSNYIRVNTPAGVEYLYFGANEDGNIYLPTPNRAKELPTIQSQNPLWIEYTNRVTESDVYSEKRASFKSEVDAIVYSSSTSKQLVDLWPEVEQFIPLYLNDPSKGIQLPAIVTSGINAKLGL